MPPMRVLGEVVGLHESVGDNTEVEMVRADERGVIVDAAAEQELAQAMKEADVQEGVSVEDAFARLPPRMRIG